MIMSLDRINKINRIKNFSMENRRTCFMISHKVQEIQEFGVWGSAPVQKTSCLSCTPC